MDLDLRKSTEEDINEISEIYMTEFSKSPYNENWTTEKAIKKMKFFKEFYDLYTVFKGKTIVGFICINPNFMCPGEVAFGEDMAIKEEFQNKGFGTWVLNEIFKIYKKKGFNTFMGIANVNSGAYSLYRKLGIFTSKENVFIEKKL
jgi:GNAT superfamily N-acetyltransferase